MSHPKLKTTHLTLSSPLKGGRESNSRFLHFISYTYEGNFSFKKVCERGAPAGSVTPKVKNKNSKTLSRPLEGAGYKKIPMV